jgi:exopolyphosphatase/guanosine-5'-triphosphate,3'-diphosphate pyrophosphatase
MATQAAALVAIIDIGSNSVRLVVYRGINRAPVSIFNEKIMCGLGKGVGQTGRLDEKAVALALETLSRFALLCRDMAVDNIEAVATAAIRDADNGQEFIQQVALRCGITVRILTGEEEAYFSALGVLAAIPEAEGVVGDLGGGSLELIRVARGTLHERISLPLGPLNLLAIPDPTSERITAKIRSSLQQVDWLKAAKGQPIYMVGGAWRALCHLHIYLTRHPLPIIHHHVLETSELVNLAKQIKTLDKRQAAAIPNFSERRLPALPIALQILRELTREMQSKTMIASAYGLREGLLFHRLTPAQQNEDPLIAAARAEAEWEGRFAGHGEALMRWMNDLFEERETPQMQRLRYAACLLSDVAWRGHPDFRAERALDASLYANFIGVDVPGRLMIGTALAVCYGANPHEGRLGQLVGRLLRRDEVDLATAWGYTLRLGQRLTAGTATPLQHSNLKAVGQELVLNIAPEYADLYGELVERRLKLCAEALGLKPRFVIAS